MPILWLQDALQAKREGHSSKSKMNYKAVISIHENIEDIYKVILPEVKKWERSNFEMKKDKKELRFIIEAKDSVALRATLNSITQLLTVYEKVKEIDG